MGASVGIFEVLIIVVIVAILVWPYWRIFDKAGFSPWLSLLMLIPIANIIMTFFLAFARWPALESAGRRD
jgi:hypothetical protein